MLSNNNPTLLDVIVVVLEERENGKTSHTVHGNDSSVLRNVFPKGDSYFGAAVWQQHGNSVAVFRRPLSLNLPAPVKKGKEVCDIICCSIAYNSTNMQEAGVTNIISIYLLEMAVGNGIRWHQ